MPSKFVFPGGAADPCDGNLIDCARRELREETGLTVAAGAAFLLFFRAITPPGRPRRFDARFFLVDAAHIEGEPDDFSRAEPELSHLQWVPLNTAAQLDLPFITEVVLAEVAKLAGTDGALRVPGQIPFFDNSGDTPRFRTLPG